MKRTVDPIHSSYPFISSSEQSKLNEKQLSLTEWQTARLIIGKVEIIHNGLFANQHGGNVAELITRLFHNL